MKLIFENWKRYLKEDVVPVDFPKQPPAPPGDIDKPVARLPLPGTPEPDPDLINFVNGIEAALGKKLEDLYGRHPMDIPVEKIVQLEVAMKEIDKLLDLLDPEPYEEPEGESP